MSTAHADNDISAALSRLSNIAAETDYIREMFAESRSLLDNAVSSVPFNYGYAEESLTYIVNSIDEFTQVTARETDGTWDLNTGEVRRYELFHNRNVVISRSLVMEGVEQERLSLITEQIQTLYGVVLESSPSSRSLSNSFSFDYEHVLSILEYLEYGLKAHISLINSLPSYASDSLKNGMDNEHIQ